MMNDGLIEHGRAICYSGYREGQRPEHIYPTYDQIKEDLLILKDNWDYIRLYDCSPHAETVFKVIKKEGLKLQVMVGVDLKAEMSNPGCPWGAEYSDEQLQSNREYNSREIDRLIKFSALFSEHILALSIGNEAAVEWGDNIVSLESLLSYARRVKLNCKHPVTYCENYVPWQEKLKTLVDELDFISLHTYPVWEYKSIDEAMDYTKENYKSVADKYPDKKIVITEAGWCTNSNGRGMDPLNASDIIQAGYCRELLKWADDNKILTFLFEAFDEEWKGSDDPLEPEKHWGIYNLDRSPKLVVEKL